MRAYILIATVATATLPVMVNAALGGACSVNGTPGVCLATATCASGGGTTHTGFCPNDPTDIKCCTKTCSTNGVCRLVSSCTSGNTLVGLCPGPANVRCCLPASSCAATAVSAATLDLIKTWEGFVARPAPDPIGLPTVGYGHLCQTKGCSEVPYSFPLTTTSATALLRSDVKTFENCVSRDIKDSIRLNANQYGALVSWAFNVGCGNTGSSDLIKRLNGGESPNTVAAQELPRWNKAGGQVLPGLVNRRAAEVRFFQTASSAAGHPPSC